MANTLITPTIITNESLRIFKNELVAGRSVNTQYADYFGETPKIGSNISIRKPVRFTTRNGRVAVIQDVTESATVLTVAQQIGVDIQFTSADMTLTIDRFNERYLKPAVAQLANGVDTAVINTFLTTPNSVGTPGTTPNSATPWLNAGALLDSNTAPKDNMRTAIMEPYAQAGLVDNLKGIFNPTGTISDQYLTGNMGRAFGIMFNMSQNIQNRTVGPLGGTPAVNGAAQTGSTLVTNGWTAAAASRLNTGDVFTIAGVFRVNPQSRITTNQLQQFVVTAPVSSDAGGNATIPIYPPINPGGGVGLNSTQYQNVTNSPASGALLTVVGTAGTVTPQNLLFHRDAATLACIPLDLPPGGVIAAKRATDPDTGLSIRMIQDYDVINDLYITRFDVLFGTALIYPEWAVRVNG